MNHKNFSFFFQKKKDNYPNRTEFFNHPDSAIIYPKPTLSTDEDNRKASAEEKDYLEYYKSTDPNHMINDFSFENCKEVNKV